MSRPVVIYKRGTSSEGTKVLNEEEARAQAVERDNEKLKGTYRAARSGGRRKRRRRRRERGKGAVAASPRQNPTREVGYPHPEIAARQDRAYGLLAEEYLEKASGGYRVATQNRENAERIRRDNLGDRW